MDARVVELAILGLLACIGFVVAWLSGAEMFAVLFAALSGWVGFEIGSRKPRR